MSVDLPGEAFLIQPCGGGRGEWKNKMKRINEKQRKRKGWRKGWGTNLDKRESAMLSALPPGSSTPLCSHLQTKNLLRIVSCFLCCTIRSIRTLFLKSSSVSPGKFFVSRIKHPIRLPFFSWNYKSDSLYSTKKYYHPRNKSIPLPTLPYL